MLFESMTTQVCRWYSEQYHRALTMEWDQVGLFVLFELLVFEEYRQCLEWYFRSMVVIELSQGLVFV